MNNDQDKDQVRLTIEEAAKALGITPSAVRMRIRRRQVPCHKVDGRWYVDLHTDQDKDQGPVQPDQVNVQAETHAPNAVPSAALTRSLEDQITWLRAELERKDREHARELQRRDELLAMALAKVPEPPKQLAPAPTEPRRPWWRFWK